MHHQAGRADNFPVVGIVKAIEDNLRQCCREPKPMWKDPGPMSFATHFPNLAVLLVMLGGFAFFTRFSMGLCRRLENQTRVARVNLAFWSGIAVLGAAQGWPILA